MRSLVLLTAVLTVCGCSGGALSLPNQSVDGGNADGSSMQVATMKWTEACLASGLPGNRACCGHGSTVICTACLAGENDEPPFPFCDLDMGN